MSIRIDAAMLHLVLKYPGSAQGRARSPHGLMSLSLALRKAAQGPQGFFNLLRARVKKVRVYFPFFSRKVISGKRPCGPCAANNDAAKLGTMGCGDLAQTLRKGGKDERICTQTWPKHPLHQCGNNRLYCILERPHHGPGGEVCQDAHNLLCIRSLFPNHNY